MKGTVAVLSACISALVAAAPTPTQNKRSVTSDCAQYGETTVGSYIVYDDLWGESNGSGSQCVAVTGLSDSSLTWSTTWSWSENPDDVKSFANAVYSFTASKLSSITSMESKWDWTYTGESVVADVAYDMFTSSTATGAEEFEVMVWIAALGGAGPISATYSASGKAESIASPNVAGHNFSLYKGSNGVQTVYSFVASQNITNFNADIRDFFTYLITDQGFDSSQYLVSVGAGTEAFTGSNAEFVVSGYSMEIATSNADISASTTTSPATSSAAATSSSIANTSSGILKSTSATSLVTSASATVASISTTFLSSSKSVPKSSATKTSIAKIQTSMPVQPSRSTSSSNSAPTAPATPDGSGPDCEVRYVFV
ncbi:glycoside hydrolase family 12 protein [Acidomyces richmondensis BFW]|nr:MAG: glycoside hydrolase family 12 protein [Acidomyces sp. 'richmondensis']KYG41859.1 glycoside hydrolase family 12 protein [Acidomyces richmondensis BFW]